MRILQIPLQRCWCPAENHHGIFRGTSGPKVMGVSPPTGPSEVLIWKAAITLTVLVWTAHIVSGANRKEVSCLVPVRCYLAFHSIGCSLVRSDFLGMHKLFWAGLSSSIFISPSRFTPTLLPGWSKCFPLSSLITVAGMAGGTVI